MFCLCKSKAKSESLDLMFIRKAIRCFYYGSPVLCSCGLCFQDLLDRSLCHVQSVPQDTGWCRGTDEGALVRTAGNVIALSISGMGLLLSVGRCYLSAMKH